MNTRQQAEIGEVPFIPRVFLSHSSADNDFGKKLAEQLEAKQIDVFYDSHGGLVGGDVWVERLQHEITERNVFVLLLSPQAFASRWVRKELRAALIQADSVGGKVIIPVLHLATEVWLFLSDYQMVSFLPSRSFEEAFDDLVAAIHLGHSRLTEITHPVRPPFDLNELPRPERFIGRTEDIEWVHKQLVPDEPDILGLASIAATNGLAGIGKTALAAKMVSFLHGTSCFPDGIAVVRCHELKDPVMVLKRILARFDPQRREPPETKLQELRDLAQRVFHDKHTLVVLDNVEPDWSIEEVTRTLRAAGAALLLTSRQRLPSAAIPLESSRLLGLLAPKEAYDVFATYSGRGGRMDLTAEEQKAVERITAALGYHTLAVKLAAARAQGRDLAQLARAYEADPRLGLGLKDGSEAVEVVLASSVADLSNAAQRLFAALGAFATGDIGRQAVLKVARSLGDKQSEQSLDMITDLRLADQFVNESLPAKADRERLRLHLLVQTYARHQLAQWSEQERTGAYAALADWYVEYTAPLVNSDPALRANVDLAVIYDEVNITHYDEDTITRAKDDITGALEWAYQHRLEKAVLDLCVQMCDFWLARWRLSVLKRFLGGEPKKNLQGAVDIAKPLAQNRDSNTEQYKKDWIQWAKLVRELATAYRRGGESKEAEPILKSALRAVSQAKVQEAKGIILKPIGQLALSREQLQQADDYLQQAFIIAQKAKDQEEMASILTSWGRVALHQGEFNVAWKRLSKALRLRRKQRNRREEGVVLNDRGRVPLARGEPKDLEQAENPFQQALSISREKGVINRQGEGENLACLGWVALARGQLAEAEDFFRQALKIARDVRDRIGEGAELGMLARVALAQGNLRKAICYVTKSSQIARRASVSDQRQIVRNCLTLGRILEARRDLSKSAEQRQKLSQKAKNLYERGLRLAEKRGLGPEFADAQLALGQLLARQEDHRKDGCEYLLKAMQSFERMGMEKDRKTALQAREKLCKG